MKIAFSTISSVALLLVAYVASADAQEMADKVWYGEVSLGYGVPNDPDYTFKNGTRKIPLDNGVTARLTLGHDFGDVRGDVRVAYYDLDGASQIGSTSITSTDLIYLSATVNGNYDFKVHDKLTPFISAGAGLAGGRGEGTVVGSTEVGSQVSIAPAIRAGFGASYAINEKVSIVVDYDYLYNFASVASGKIDNFGIHSGNVGLRFGF